MARIDGKYEELRELSREGPEALLEVSGPEGATLRLGWFDVSTPAARARFHRYRADLRALNPAGLADVVARPGAYYALWRPLEGEPLAVFEAASSRPPEAVEALRDLSARLAERGYALADAEIVFQGSVPLLARLAPVERTPQEAEALSAPVLARLSGGKLRRRRRPLNVLGALLSVVPGLLFLSGAGYLGARAAQTYLNPPVGSVPEVVGQEAQRAADTLVKTGYRVAFADGESADARVGSVIGQSPDSGAALPAGRLVTLTVNNPPSLTVPRLEELNLTQVKSALSEVGLRLGTVLTVDGGVTGTPKGRVVAQLPGAGAPSARGQKVQLMVSGGIRARQTFLPDLTGLSFEEARALVRKAQLVVATVRTQSSEAPENSVLAQRPRPYAKVDVNSPVTLTVARTPVDGPAASVPTLPIPPRQAAPQQTGPRTAPPAGQAGASQDGTSQSSTAREGGSLNAAPQDAAPPGTSAQDGAPTTGAADAAGTTSAPTDAPADATPTETTPPADSTSTGTPSTGTPSTDAAPPASAPADTALPDSMPPDSMPPAATDTAPPGEAPADAQPSASQDAAAPSSRSVSLDYTFPAQLPDGTVQLFVRDADGERQLDFAQPSSAVAGARAEGNVAVRGPAVFSVRVNGQEVGTFTR